MGLRNSLLASFAPTGGGQGVLGTLVTGGLDILNTFLASRFQQDSAPPGLPVASGGAGSPMLAVSAAVAAAGGRIVGGIIRISRTGWAAVAPHIKNLAIALGLTVAFTDVGLDLPGIDLLGGGGGGALSQSQQRKMERFQQLTAAGVPPAMAARATSIVSRPRRGLSWFELRGFHKVSKMLGRWGMRPRPLARGGGGVRRHRHRVTSV